MIMTGVQLMLGRSNRQRSGACRRISGIFGHGIDVFEAVVACLHFSRQTSVSQRRMLVFGDALGISTV
jgi:hypothetical protein